MKYLIDQYTYISNPSSKPFSELQDTDDIRIDLVDIRLNNEFIMYLSNLFSDDLINMDVWNANSKYSINT
jgi:hypothetical protein